jgi:zinc protease
VTAPAVVTSRCLVLLAWLALGARPGLAQVDRSGPPQAGPVRSLRLPPPERHALSNGLPVLLVPMREVPVVELVLVVRAGATADPQGSEGLAHMTAAMLDEGAGGKDALALADALDFLGAELETGASWDAASVRLRVPVVRLQAALPLLADVALRPDFPEAELDRLRKEALTELLQARDVPGRIASRALWKAVFGAEHRYGRPETGDAASLSRLRIEDLRLFHAARYSPEAATLVVVGDVGAEVLTALETSFGAWARSASAGPAPKVEAPRQVAGRAIWLVDKPAAPQSALRFGRVGPSWQDPQYPAGEVMNTLLGGSFASRLNDNLREQHGYTYGARSSLQRLREAGLFLAGADVQADKTAPAVSEVFKELDRIQTPASEDEVARARSYAALGFAAEFETTGQVAGHLVDQVVFDLPDGFFEAFVPKALATDAAALQSAARAAIDTGAIVVVVVGDRKTVEEPLRALGLGSVSTLSLEDVMGEAPTIE